MEKKKIDKLIKNFNNRNIDVEYFENIQDANNMIIEIIGTNKKIGIGNSKTIKAMNIVNLLEKEGNKVIDKTRATTKEESIKLKRESLLTQYYLSGANAISVDGSIVNIDHSGNRVAALLYGPEKVIIVVGKNKIAMTQKEAVERVKNVAAPRNAKRAGFNPPCVELGECIDCNSKERVCNSLVVINGQSSENRMRLLIIDEKLGF